MHREGGHADIPGVGGCSRTYFERLKESLPRQGFVTDDVYVSLRGNATELWLKSMLTMAYDFGFRKSELLNLRVRQIDLTDRTIKLNRGETKTTQPGRW